MVQRHFGTSSELVNPNRSVLRNGRTVKHALSVYRPGAMRLVARFSRPADRLDRARDSSRSRATPEPDDRASPPFGMVPATDLHHRTRTGEADDGPMGERCRKLVRRPRAKARPHSMRGQCPPGTRPSGARSHVSAAPLPWQGEECEWLLAGNFSYGGAEGRLRRRGRVASRGRAWSRRRRLRRGREAA